MRRLSVLFVVFVSGVVAAMSSASGQTAATAEKSAEGVKLLRSFEIGEMKKFGIPGKYHSAHWPPAGYRATPPGAA